MRYLKVGMGSVLLYCSDGGFGLTFYKEGSTVSLMQQKIKEASHLKSLQIETYKDIRRKWWRKERIVINECENFKFQKVNSKASTNLQRIHL